MYRMAESYIAFERRKEERERERARVCSSRFRQREGNEDKREPELEGRNRRMNGADGERGEEFRDVPTLYARASFYLELFPFLSYLLL